jgi:peroxiredoxin Q/BCP
VTKQSLPYTLLCDPSFGLIKAIGMAQDLSSSKTKRGVWAVDKEGKVLLSFTGGPDPTVDAAGKLVGRLKKD